MGFFDFDFCDIFIHLAGGGFIMIQGHDRQGFYNSI